MCQTTYFINENYRILNIDHTVNEGGMSRNYAMMRWIQDNIPDLKEIRLGSSRICNIMRVLHLLQSVKNSRIIFQYVTVGVPLFNKSIPGRLISRLFLWHVKKSTDSNSIIFDVSDLKYEQSIDLNINLDRIEIIKKFEERFFKLPVKFIFASNSMKDYACRKYTIKPENTDVLINGGKKLEEGDEDGNEIKYLHLIDSNKVNFVYAGTLNKGRQIETMLLNFPDNPNICLIIMGNDGEWVCDAIHQNNIIYLGSMEEEEAHRIASKCDIGLIPYDNSRDYYNMAYPTKLSFYITAGIPFLSTPVEEVKSIHNRYQIGYIESIENWADIINGVSKNVIDAQKSYIATIRNEFYWNNIFSSVTFLKCEPK